MTTTAPPPTPPSLELKTYWCHECDMSVSLTSSHTPSPSPPLCPQFHTHFLELMDSPFSQNDADSFLHSSSSLFDVVFQDALLLLAPSPRKMHTTETILPIITVTETLLSLLDPNGVVLCAVCKDAISVDEEAKQLPCDHLYHSDCITPWLHLRSSCPLCRFRISEDENEDENDEEDLNGASNVSESRVSQENTDGDGICHESGKPTQSLAANESNETGKSSKLGEQRDGKLSFSNSVSDMGVYGCCMVPSSSLRPLVGKVSHILRQLN